MSLYTGLGIVMNLMRERRLELIFQELLLRLTNKITQVTIRPSTPPQYPGQTLVLYQSGPLDAELRSDMGTLENRSFPCIKATLILCHKDTAKGKKYPPMGFGCLKLCLYSIKES